MPSPSRLDEATSAPIPGRLNIGLADNIMADSSRAISYTVLRSEAAAVHQAVRGIVVVEVHAVAALVGDGVVLQVEVFGRIAAAEMVGVVLDRPGEDGRLGAVVGRPRLVRPLAAAEVSPRKSGL